MIEKTLTNSQLRNALRDWQLWNAQDPEKTIRRALAVVRILSRSAQLGEEWYKRAAPFFDDALQTLAEVED